MDPSAPATVYLVQLIIEASGTELTPALAELLLFGLCTDTGFFRHLNTHSQPVFAAAGRLVAAGADPQTVYQRIGGGRTFLHRRLLGTLLARTEQHRGRDGCCSPASGAANGSGRVTTNSTICC